MDITDARRDLAAAFRYTARLRMNESIANHYSLAISGDAQRFLINPYGHHWSKIRASELLELDSENPLDGEREDVDPTAWAIHGALHRSVPHAQCIMHLHPKYATALACLRDPVLPPIDQNAMRFYNRVAIDHGYDGMGLGDEAKRLARVLGNRSVMIMCQHGLLVVGQSVARCFDDIYYFERAAETYITVLMTGKELNVASEAVAEKTARQWEDYPRFADKHFAAIRSVLDEEEPEYRQ